MKATLEFNLPEDREEHLRAVLAKNLCSVLFEYDSWLRNKVKYPTQEEEAKFEEAREILNEIMDKNNINLDELYS